VSEETLQLSELFRPSASSLPQLRSLALSCVSRMLRRLARLFLHRQLSCEPLMSRAEAAHALFGAGELPRQLIVRLI
jgi:hypothetical protein